MGFPPEFFTVLFAIPRMAGYLAHWRESLDDPDTKIIRPQQVCQYFRKQNLYYYNYDLWSWLWNRNSQLGMWFSSSVVWFHILGWENPYQLWLESDRNYEVCTFEVTSLPYLGSLSFHLNFQVYTGVWLRHYMPLKERMSSTDADKLTQVSISNASRRRLAGSGV